MGTLRNIRTNIKTILNIAPGLKPERIVLGYWPFESNDEFFNDLITDGPFIKIHKGTSSDYAWSKELGRFEVKLTLYFGFDRSLPFDYLDIEDLEEVIRLSLLKSSNWSGVVSPSTITTTEQNIDTNAATITVETRDFVLVWDSCH